jgi:hypothetical protein
MPWNKQVAEPVVGDMSLRLEAIAGVGMGAKV